MGQVCQACRRPEATPSPPARSPSAPTPSQGQEGIPLATLPSTGQEAIRAPASSSSTGSDREETFLLASDRPLTNALERIPELKPRFTVCESAFIRLQTESCGSGPQRPATQEDLRALDLLWVTPDFKRKVASGTLSLAELVSLAATLRKVEEEEGNEGMGRRRKIVGLSSAGEEGSGGED